MIPGKIAMVKELRAASEGRLGLYESKVLVDTLDDIPFRDVSVRWNRMLNEVRAGVIARTYIVSLDGTYMLAGDCRAIELSDAEEGKFSQMSDSERWEYVYTHSGRRIK